MIFTKFGHARNTVKRPGINWNQLILVPLASLTCFQPIGLGPLTPESSLESRKKLIFDPVSNKHNDAPDDTAAGWRHIPRAHRTKHVALACNQVPKGRRVGWGSGFAL
jgi:hypothetical protein